MRKQLLGFGLAILMLLVVTPAAAFGQQTVRGQVTNADTGEPIAGVQVTVVGTRIGTLTNEQGRFVLREVPADAEQVRFQLIGYESTVRPITGATMTVALAPTAVQLEGLTVTALGIERQSRSLGYDVQDLSADDVVDVPESNFLNMLQGKLSGANITTSSYPGGSTRITLRGENSITGNNRALIVVDGVPLVDKGGGAGTYGGYDYGNTANLIDSYNIESISVLKGASAAALYGSRASNGAILIETKSGQEAQAGWQIKQSVEISRPMRLPDYQNQYGQGFTECAYTGETGCDGLFSWADGAGGGTFDFFDESWGPPMDCQPVDQWYGEDEPFCPHPDNVRDFFETGVSSRTNLSFNASGETYRGRIGLTYENTGGMAPGNTMENIAANLKGSLDVTDDFTVSASAQYIRDRGERRPATGYSDLNMMQQFVWFGRQVDTERLKDWRCEEGERACEVVPGRIQENWNYNYHDNPYLLQLGHNNHDETDRVIGNVEADYQFNEWLTGTFKTGVDWFREHRKREFMIGTQAAPDGAFGVDNIFSRELNVRALLQAEGLELSEDFSLNVNAGANLRDNHDENEGISVDQLNVPGIYSVNNAAVDPSVSQFTADQRVYSLFGDAELGYRNYAFLSVTGRNDWSSTLPEDDRSYFYPSVSTSLVFTEAFGLESDLLTYGKLRGSWSKVGNDTDPYQLQQTLNIGTRWAGTPGYTVPNRLPNLDLQPEETESWEGGIDLEFWGGRLMASYTYYHATTRRQIMPIQVSATTGYSGQVTNAGEMRNKGHEVQVRARPVEGDEFSWDVRANWSMNDNEVVDLAGDLETLVLDNYWNGSLEARVGEPYGVLRGLSFEETEDGEPILTETPYGPLPARFGEKKVLDESRPDWTANLTNTFSYGRFQLSTTFAGQMGGAIFSTTKWFGMYAGVLEETLRGRENGPCDPGIELEGVNKDGDPVSGTVCPQAYFENMFNSTAAGLVDQTYVKLRNARLAYRVPGSFAQTLGFEAMTVALIGKNLWMASDAEHIDPDHAVRANNVQGWEHGQFPTARTIGMSLSITP